MKKILLVAVIAVVAGFGLGFGSLALADLGKLPKYDDPKITLTDLKFELDYISALVINRCGK